MATTEWKIVCTDDKKDPVPISVGKTVIGRGHLLQIRELKVSRHHAEVQVTDDDDFILKAMHPGLPCYYQKKGDDTKHELLRGSTIKLEHSDTFSLHSNPDCQFRVIKGPSGDSNGDVDPPADGKSNDNDITAKSDKQDENSDKSEEEEEEQDEEVADEKVEDDEEEPEEEDDGSDWDEPKKKNKVSPKKKPKPSRAKKPSSRSPAKKKPRRRQPSSDEEEINESSQGESAQSEDSEYDGGKRSRRQPARKQQAKLPPRRSASKPVSYNEELMLEGMTPSEEEEEKGGNSSDDDGLPSIGRVKKDSDSDFEVDEDSASDWDEKPSKKSVGRSRPPPKTSTSARRGRRKKGSDSESEDEEEYIPRPSKRRGAAANRKSLKEQSDSDYSE